MKVYLAARYSRRLELCVYRDLIIQAGHEVPARWLNGEHQVSDAGTPIGETGEALVEGDDESGTECAARLRQQFALEDFQDVLDCDLLIAFTEAPRSGASRGGRHVELGMALGMKKKVIVCGPRENIFCWLPDVIHAETPEAAFAALPEASYE